MKAVISTKFGPPESLRIADVDTPTPAQDEVLVRVYASTVTGSDCNLRNLTFVPSIFRLPARLGLVGIVRPRIRILGVDLAGKVAAVGKNVKRFAVGDRVFGTSGMGCGSHAEYVCIKENGAIAIKPDNLSWGEAAGVANGALTAFHFLKELAQVKPGQRVLIIGASGGIGTYAVQLGKAFGAQVTGVCSTANVSLVTSLGADRVIDYTREDYEKSAEQYDVIFDVVGAKAYGAMKHCLAKDGIYLINLIKWSDVPALLRDPQHIKSGAAPDSPSSLETIRDLLESGTLRSVIGRVVPFEQIAQAYRYVEEGHKVGSIVIAVRPLNQWQE